MCLNLLFTYIFFHLSISRIFLKKRENGEDRLGKGEEGRVKNTEKGKREDNWIQGKRTK
jgi:hypothetical protein